MAPYRRSSGGHFYPDGISKGATCADCGVSLYAWQSLTPCARHGLSKLDALRRVFRDRFDDIYYVAPSDRVDLIAVARSAMIDLGLGHPVRLSHVPPMDWTPLADDVRRSAEEIARRIDVATEIILMIEAANARGDRWAVDACRGGRMSIEELRLRVVITGRVPAGCTYV